MPENCQGILWSNNLHAAFSSTSFVKAVADISKGGDNSSKEDRVRKLGTAPQDLISAARVELQLCKQQAQNVWEVLLFEAACSEDPAAAENLVRTAIKSRLINAVEIAEKAAKGAYDFLLYGGRTTIFRLLDRVFCLLGN